MIKSERWHIESKLKELRHQIEKIEKGHEKELRKRLKPLERKIEQLEGQIREGAKYNRLKDPCSTCNGTGRVMKRTGCPNYLDFDDVTEDICLDCEG